MDESREAPREGIVAIAARLAATGGDDLPRESYDRLFSWMANRYGSEDVAAEAIIRLLAHQGAVDPQRAAGWLQTTARRLAWKMRHSVASEVVVQITFEAGDDDTELRLSRIADREAVRAGLVRALDGGGHYEQVYAVMVAWLAIADETPGRRPPSRIVAARVGVSHVTVISSLRIFGKLLTAEVSSDSSEGSDSRARRRAIRPSTDHDEEAADDIDETSQA